MQSTQDAFPLGAGPVPGSPHAAYVAARLAETGRWGTETLADCVDRHAVERPDASAFVAGSRRLNWAGMKALTDHYAAVMLALGVESEERVAVLLPDGPLVHAMFVGLEKAGAIAVGIGPRAGRQEIAHLIRVSGATTMVTTADHRGSDMIALVGAMRSEGLPLERHLVVNLDDPEDVRTAEGPIIPESGDARTALAERRLGLSEIFLLNSTSGTTGMPKCVVHTQNRWRYFHKLAVDAGHLTTDDVFMGLIPAPFGFGIWTAHTTPIILGAPTIVMERFDAASAIELIERERVTVLSCVSTQFIMMLNSPALDEHDLSSLRCMFTGGEAVPYERAAEFEQRTGARVLQFYGSNETGALSRTRLRDTPEQRLRTAGRMIDEMQVRLFSEAGDDVTTTSRRGQAACAGPATCLGYYADPEANTKLFTADGWMLTGDVVTIDDDYLTVVGRVSDFIIRGGKNISAAAVEEQASSHPAIALVAAVAMPDPVYGERVCLFAVLRDGMSLTLEQLTDHMLAQGVSKEILPEFLEFVEDLPRSSGGKIAKGELRARLRRASDAGET